MDKNKLINNLEFILQDKKIMADVAQNEGLIIGNTKKEILKMLTIGNLPFVSDTTYLEIYYDEETKAINIQVSNGKKTRTFFSEYAKDFNTIKRQASSIIQII